MNLSLKIEGDEVGVHSIRMDYGVEESTGL